MKNRGFSLIEVAIAVTIISVAIVPFLLVITQNIKAVTLAKQKFLASNYAKELMEEIRLKAFDEKVTTTSSAVKPWSDLGSDSETLRNNKFDDIDDYTDYIKEVNTKKIYDLTDNIESDDYYRKVSVEYIDDIVFSVTDSAVKTNTKKVTVSCYYKDYNDKPLAELNFIKSYR